MPTTTWVGCGYNAFGPILPKNNYGYKKKNCIVNQHLMQSTLEDSKQYSNIVEFNVVSIDYKLKCPRLYNLPNVYSHDHNLLPL